MCRERKNNIRQAGRTSLAPHCPVSLYENVSIRLSVCLPVCPSIRLPVLLYIYVCVCVFACVCVPVTFGNVAPSKADRDAIKCFCSAPRRY